MLVLSRKENESIMIGDNIWVQVSAIRGNKVVLRIEAPPKIPILRNELLKRKDRERIANAALEKTGDKETPGGR